MSTHVYSGSLPRVCRAQHGCRYRRLPGPARGVDSSRQGGTYAGLCASRNNPPYCGTHGAFSVHREFHPTKRLDDCTGLHRL